MHNLQTSRENTRLTFLLKSSQEHLRDGGAQSLKGACAADSVVHQVPNTLQDADLLVSERQFAFRAWRHDSTEIVSV